MPRITRALSSWTADRGDRTDRRPVPVRIHDQESREARTHDRDGDGGGHLPRDGSHGLPRAGRRLLRAAREQADDRADGEAEQHARAADQEHIAERGCRRGDGGARADREHREQRPWRVPAHRVREQGDGRGDDGEHEDADGGGSGHDRERGADEHRGEQDSAGARLHPDAVAEHVVATVQRGEGAEAGVDAQVETPQHPQHEEGHRHADRGPESHPVIAPVRSDAQDTCPHSSLGIRHRSSLRPTATGPKPRCYACDVRRSVRLRSRTTFSTRVAASASSSSIPSHRGAVRAAIS